MSRAQRIADARGAMTSLQQSGSAVQLCGCRLHSTEYFERSSRANNRTIFTIHVPNHPNPLFARVHVFCGYFSGCTRSREEKEVKIGDDFTATRQRNNNKYPTTTTTWLFAWSTVKRSKSVSDRFIFKTDLSCCKWRNSDIGQSNLNVDMIICQRPPIDVWTLEGGNTASILNIYYGFFFFFGSPERFGN